MRPGIHDFISLWALRVAKRGSLRLREAHREFYERFFDRARAAEYYLDVRRILRYRELRRGLAMVSLPRSVRALDVGCGVGDGLAALPKGWTRVGVDLALADLTYARDMLCAREDTLALVQASAVHLPFADSTFDLVTCFEVLEHLPDDRAALSEIVRVLRPDGTLVMSVPGTYWFPEYRELMGHYRHYSPAALVELLAQSGLQTVAFLNPYRIFHLVYFYVYVALWVLNFLITKVLRRPGSPHTRRIPVLQCNFYSRLVVPPLLKLAALEARKWRGQASTFVVARRASGSATGHDAAGIGHHPDL